MAFQAPVTVLQANTKRDTGKKAQYGNILAGKVRGACSSGAGHALPSAVCSGGGGSAGQTPRRFSAQPPLPPHCGIATLRAGGGGHCAHNAGAPSHAQNAAGRQWRHRADKRRCGRTWLLRLMLLGGAAAMACYLLASQGMAAAAAVSGLLYCNLASPCVCLNFGCCDRQRHSARD